MREAVLGHLDEPAPAITVQAICEDVVAMYGGEKVEALASQSAPAAMPRVTALWKLNDQGLVQRPIQ